MPRPFRPCVLAVLFLVLGNSLGLADWRPDEALVQRATTQWEADIRRLEQRDREETHPDDAILFVGSSSIRLWDTIAEDMAPYRVIQRGYGGAKFSDLAVFAERLIRPHRFRALVLFVANDVSGEADDATPEQVLAWFHHIVAVARAHQPDAPIFCIEITPTRSRWPLWPRTSAVNAALAAACAEEPRLHFIPTASAFLDARGEPRAELFVEDQLHLNRLGYQIWAGIISSHLDSALRVKPSAARARNSAPAARS